MSGALAAAAIHHNLDLWGHDVSHDWPWWKVQMNQYIPRLFSTDAYRSLQPPGNKMMKVTSHSSLTGELSIEPR